MFKKIITSMFIAAAVSMSPMSFDNSIAEAGYVGGVQGNDIEVDDSSVYRVGKNHVRVIYYIIMNRLHGSGIQDTADVQWGEKQRVILNFNKNKDWRADFEEELKVKLLNYCKKNYS